MQLGSALSEIGVLETARVLENYIDDEEIINTAVRFMPIPYKGFADNKISEAASYLMNTGKSKLLFLTPELALFERLHDIGWDGYIIVVLAADIEEETRTRIKSNKLNCMRIEFINEGTFPRKFAPSNGAIVTVGFESYGRSLITRTNYRMLSLYHSFLGQKVLISCFPEGLQVRPINWMLANTVDFFSHVV